MTNEDNVNPGMDWVTQDVVGRRKGVDEYRWLTKYGPLDGITSSWDITPDGASGKTHGYIDAHGARLEVRCKRKDLPILGKAESRMVYQDELNSATRTRAWTFGVPAKTGHFLLSWKDPALQPQEILANTLTSPYKGDAVWFVYLGQTSDFVDPVAQKAKYTLLTDPKEPNGAWLRRPDEIQDALNRGWLFVTEREFEVPEWD